MPPKAAVVKSKWGNVSLKTTQQEIKDAGYILTASDSCLRGLYASTSLRIRHAANEYGKASRKLLSKISLEPRAASKENFAYGTGLASATFAKIPFIPEGYEDYEPLQELTMKGIFWKVSALTPLEEFCCQLTLAYLLSTGNTLHQGDMVAFGHGSPNYILIGPTETGLDWRLQKLGRDARANLVLPKEFSLPKWQPGYWFGSGSIVRFYVNFANASWEVGGNELILGTKECNISMTEGRFAKELGMALTSLQAEALQVYWAVGYSSYVMNADWLPKTPWGNSVYALQEPSAHTPEAEVSMGVLPLNMLATLIPLEQLPCFNNKNTNLLISGSRQCLLVIQETLKFLAAGGVEKLILSYC